MERRGLQAFKVGFRGFKFRKETLFGLELSGVDAATASFDADWMLKMKHLVVKEVFDGATGGVGAIEDPAYDDGVMSSVIVAQHAAGMVSGPCEGGSA